MLHVAISQQRRWPLIGVLLLCGWWLPSCWASGADSLPPTVVAALKRANIPLESVALQVQRVDSDAPLLSWQADKAFNPASTMKLLTTLAGLDLLGPAYRWKTEVYLDGPLKNGVLHGNLIFKGYGDPAFSVERLWWWLTELRQRGIREIRGDLILDQSFFQLPPFDPAAFDGAGHKTYNVGPSALLLGGNALQLRVIDGQLVLQPQLAGYQLENQARYVKRACQDDSGWSMVRQQNTLVVTGELPQGCSELGQYVSLLSNNEYFYAVFKSLWHSLGGSLHGQWREGLYPLEQAPFSTHQSPPLAQIIYDINKHSNNVMARQLFLTLGAVDDGMASNVSDSTAAVQQWLVRHNLNSPELKLENGSGLSRNERSTARLWVRLLQYAARSHYAAEYRSSLPILGVDGTLWRRFKETTLQGAAHLKTGSLADARAIAGYVQANSGSQWLLALMVNHPNAEASRAAQDALLQWLVEQ